MLGNTHLAWLDKRGIDPELATRFGICTARRGENGAVIPDNAGDILVFPFIEGEKEIGAKYRGPQKRFWQKPNARKTFWNADVLDDPALISGTHALVITEGEMDALSVIQAGYPFAVSVPDGAPPEGPVSEVTDIEHDQKYSFIHNNWERLKRIKRIVIATDNDGPGKRLAEELVRRLDRLRCSWVEYPKECKDLNDVLVKWGGSEVIRVISQAKEYPVSGLYRLSDIPNQPPPKGVSTGWSKLDENIKVYTPALMVVTGFAGQGKSTWTQQLVANLAVSQGWVTAIASFEMMIRPYVVDALGAALLDKPKWIDRRLNWSPQEERRAEQWVEEHFVFIGPDAESDDSADIGWLIERAEAAVIRHGARCIVIDPWNEVDHMRRRDESQTEYVGRAIRQLNRFAKSYNVLVIIVAHPTKSAKEKGPDQLSLYDISDSAHFANKADIGVIIARQGNLEMDTLTSVLVKKIRFQPDMGKPGDKDLDFDPVKRLFIQ